MTGNGHFPNHGPNDIGLGRGLARVLVSVGVVGFVCLLFGVILWRYVEFVEGESHARREELRMVVGEMKAQRLHDEARSQRTNDIISKAVATVESTQEALDQSILVLQGLVKELRGLKGKGG